MSLKNSKDTIRNRTCNLPVCTPLRATHVTIGFNQFTSGITLVSIHGRITVRMCLVVKHVADFFFFCQGPGHMPQMHRSL
jgi:hypothetical protein